MLPYLDTDSVEVGLTWMERIAQQFTFNPAGKKVDGDDVKSVMNLLNHYKVAKG